MDSPHQFRPIQNPNSASTLFLTITIATSFIILSAIAYFLYHFYCSHPRRSRTTPFDAAAAPPPPPFNHLRRFTYRDLKIATNNFSPSNFIGKGGSGTVYRGFLSTGKLVAVKLLDSSYQSEMEFQNELKILGGINPGRDTPVVNLLGFCVEKEKRVVVYEYVCNKSLQECLFSDADLGMNWGKRFGIILDVAKALAFLHLECEPPVIHGDVKPSNVLLDSQFRAKISDFGLSRLKIGEIDAGGGDDESPVVENDEVDFALALQASSSSKSSCKIYNNVMGFVLGNDHNDDKSGDLNCVEIDRSIDLSSSKTEPDDAGSKQWGKDWWWRQDGSGELCSKDYVMEWIGSQICANPGNWDEEKGPIDDKIGSIGIVDDSCPNPPLSKSEELVNDDPVRDNGIVEKEESRRCSKKHRKIHEWWKEERMDEVRKKTRYRKRLERVKVPHFGLGKYFDFKQIKKFRRKNRGQGDDEGDDPNMEFSFRKGWRKKNNNDNDNNNDDNANANNKSRSMGSEMWSGDLFSRELSSTTSMRGTLCYVAPEYTGFGYLMEKADVYSFGVLVLVIISGRRPLHVLSSPMKLEQANLISWSRSLAQTGNLLELVDRRLGDEYSKDDAELCINLALSCLQKMPELRPDIGDVVRVLSREMDPPPRPPLEFSPPAPGKGFVRTRKKHHKISTVD